MMNDLKTVSFLQFLHCNVNKIITLLRNFLYFTILRFNFNVLDNMLILKRD
jgi:hypothetical protein